MATIKQLKQMYDSYKKCGDCPLNDTCCGDSVSSLPDNADEIVDDWISKHPVKTYAMDFFEKFPNAKTYKGIPTTCFRKIHPELGDECYGENCVECWNREMEVNNEQN